LAEWWPATKIFHHGDLESGLLEGRTDEASTVHGRSDHRDAEGARGRGEDGGSGAQARRVGSDALQLDALQLEGKYGGMDVSEAKRLKQLEDENAKLKKFLAEQMLDAAALRELLSKKW
jgi:hypothetical protein